MSFLELGVSVVCPIRIINDRTNIIFTICILYVVRFDITHLIHILFTNTHYNLDLESSRTSTVNPSLFSACAILSTCTVRYFI